jgi:hypothetical protein
MMRIGEMTRRSMAAAAVAACTLALALLVSGCQTEYERNVAITAALNNFYSTHQDCLFSTAVKFPETADPADQAETKGLDSLVDAGLLRRTQVNETGHARHREHLVEYQLTNVGQEDWTTDQHRQGYGNFCFGHAQLSTIESATKVPGDGVTRYYVGYQDQVMLPLWATTPQVEQAFPFVAKDSAGRTATATVVKSGNSWRVLDVSPPVANPLG